MIYIGIILYFDSFNQVLYHTQTVKLIVAFW